MVHTVNESEGNAWCRKNLHLSLAHFLVQRDEIYQSWNTKEFDSSFGSACAFSGSTGPLRL